MKLFKILILFMAAAFAISNASGQANAGINILTQNSGQVTLGGTVLLEVTINSTGPTTNITANKLKTQISVPSSIASIPATGHTLPSGWSIISNDGATINLCNGTDVIVAGTSRTILIAIHGDVLGGPLTIGSQLTFSSGTNCANPGSLSGDNPSDNSSQSSITVVPAAACNLTVSASAGTIACFGGTTTLTATPSGAAGAVEYSITGGAPFQPGNTFTVPAGTYTVTAREVSTPSCTSNSSAVTVTQPTAVSASGSVTTPIAVFGGTGTITVTATGGTGSKTYVITSGTTTNTTGATSGVFTGLLAGTYTFTATDANNCTGVSAPVALNNPAACTLTAVSGSAGTILCNGGTTTLTATPTGASGAVEYSLTGGAPFQSGNTFTVSAGTYTITAREAGNVGCTATSAPVTVSQPATVTATAAVTTPIAVPGGTGTITVTGAGGTGAKTYVITSGTTINTTGATSGVFTGLLAGTYIFTAKDANNCTGVSAPLNLPNPGVATADPAVGQMYFTTTAGGVQSANNLLMAPSADLYDINVPFYNLNQLNPVPNGTISFRVNIGSKLVVAPGFNFATAPLSTYFSWAQSTVGGNVIITGTQIAEIPADFTAVAKFRVKGDSACKSNVVSNIVITNILQTLVDDDTQNNQATLQYTLPITLSKSQVNITCNGAGNGIINIVASSGTSVVTTGPGGYSNTQSLASGQNNLQLTGLAPGVYTITVTATSDAPLTSCSQVTTVTILQPSVLTIATTGSTNINCFGSSDGTISVSASGGTAPYTYTIAGPTVNTTGVNSGVFTGLAAGSYTVTVTDNNGCTATTATIVITQPVGGIPDITLGSDLTGSFFGTPGVTQTVVYNIAEIAGNASVGDTIRITKVVGFTINFNPTIFSTVVGSTTYALDNPKWKIDNSNPSFVSIILTDPMNVNGPGVLGCLQAGNVAISLTRNTTDVSTFTLSARLRKANGELNLSNNLNSIILTAE